MFVSDRVTQVPLLAGLLIAAASGCSKGSDQSATRDSAATVSAAAPAPDSMSTGGGSSDTAQPRVDSAPAARTQSAAVAQPRAKPKVRPTAAADSTSASPASAAAATAPAGQDKFLKYEAGSNTVTFELQAGPFNWNGYSSGGATLSLPPKANVVMNFVNKDGTPHSAEVISGEGAIPNAAVDPAIPRAYTNKVLEGLPQEGSDVMKFTVPATGTYRILCGVPGHGLSGMWIWMKVDPAAKTPSFGPTKK